MNWKDSDLRRLYKHIEKTDTCWLWTASIDTDGYGRFWLKDAETGESVFLSAHRFSYFAHNGAIPDGLVIDHTCRVRRCVNPAHLRLLTIVENLLCGAGVEKKSHCRKSHLLEGENLLVQSGGVRRCKQCRHASSNASYARLHQAV